MQLKSKNIQHPKHIGRNNVGGKKIARGKKLLEVEGTREGAAEGWGCGWCSSKSNQGSGGRIIVGGKNTMGGKYWRNIAGGKRLWKEKLWEDYFGRKKELWEGKNYEENIGRILWEEKYCGRKIVGGLLWEGKKIVGGKEIARGIRFLEQKLREKKEISGKWGMIIKGGKGWEEGLIVTTENSGSGWKDC